VPAKPRKTVAKPVPPKTTKPIGKPVAKTVTKSVAAPSLRPVILVLEGLSGAAESVRMAGGNVIVVNPRHLWKIDREFDKIDGLLLTGGGDVDPRRYKQKTHRHTYGVSEDRDRAEFTAVTWAREARLPILGICRGAQVMNVQAGGTLFQNIPDRLGTEIHKCSDMPVKFLAGSLAGQAIGESAEVTHLHHQSVARVGKGYRASAWHADGTIEAIESTTGIWRVGAQFHPECAEPDAPERGLFRSLVVQAALLSGLPVPTVRRPHARTVRFNPATAPMVEAPSQIIGTGRPTLVYSKVAARNGATVLEQDAAKSATRNERTVSTNGTVTYSVGSVSSYPLDSYRCYRCNVDFDLRSDYVDHMQVLHNVDLIHHALMSTELGE
jgi:putative glutamine amidotransferase